MDKKTITLEDTHSRTLRESLSIIDPMTTEQIQDFINRDYSWTTFDSAIMKQSNESEIDTEPDWTPNLN
jgi:hypothetical protein